MTQGQPTVVTVEGEATTGAPAGEVDRPSMLKVAGLPAPLALQKDMEARVEAEIAAARAERGEVALLQDTFPLLRQLCGAKDYLEGYRKAITAIEGRLKSAIEEEASDGGNHYADGKAPRTAEKWNGTAVPAANVTVPEDDGDWHITREFDRKVDVDWSQVLTPGAQAAAVAFMVEVGITDEGAHEEGRELAGRVLAAVLKDLALTASKLSPKTTGLEQLAAMYSRAGDDQTASIISGAVDKASVYKGVKVERA